jgi:hypothetical protein
MHASRLLLSAVFSAVIAAPAAADVTVRSRMAEREDGGRITEITEYRKGLKIRTDSSSPGLTRASAIIDMGTGHTIMLWHDSKTATEHNFYQTPDVPGSDKVVGSPPSMTPTSQTRAVAGSTCTVYQVRSSVSTIFMKTTEPVIFAMEGSICVVKDGPGQADFVRILRAMAERAPESNSMLKMNLGIAELGVPFASDMTITIGGTEPNAEQRKVSSTTTEVTSISTAPIPDSMFDIPPGYTLTKPKR